MKNIKLFSLIAIAFAFSISSCKKKDEPTPSLFSFPTTTDLKVEMAWTVNNQGAGDDYVDLDLLIDDETTNPYNVDHSSTSSSTFESITLSSSDDNKTSKIGVVYYADKTALSTLTSPYSITYVIKVYPVGNIAAAKTYTGVITNPPTIKNQNLVYNQISLVKSASTYRFVELSPKTTFDRGPYISTLRIASDK